MAERKTFLDFEIDLNLISRCKQKFNIDILPTLHVSIVDFFVSKYLITIYLRINCYYTL